jgi:hypothetical protein
MTGRSLRSASRLFRSVALLSVVVAVLSAGSQPVFAQSTHATPAPASLLSPPQPSLGLPLPPPPLPLPLPPPPPLPILAPPALPTIPSLPQILPSNAPTTSGSTQLPVTSARLDAKLLVISADGTEPVLGAIRQAADYAGIPYTLYVANKTPGGFTAAMLSDGAAHAYYQGIVLTTGALGWFNGTAWTSAFSPAEWQTLWDYQAKYRVRTAIAYAFPTADLGFGPATGVDATTTPISAQLTSSGQAVWSDVNASNPVTITKAWVYLAHAAGTGTNVLLSDPQSDALALVRTYPDGRQVLSLTFDNNFFLVHSLALSHGVMNWVTGGLFLGERHIFMTPQVDDVFIDDDVYGGGTYRITGTDWAAFAAWQTQKQLNSQTAKLAIHMAFNGQGTTGEYSLDTLTPAARLTSSQFPWINHTYSHENLDAATYDLAYQQITQNDQVASSMGFQNIDARALVTPDVSGLSNPAAMQAAYDAGVRYLVTDTSQPGMDNPTPQTGIRNPSQPAILMIPRRPVNLYYNVTTPTEWTNEYNSFYRTYWGRDLSYSEILDKESDVLLQYMLRGEIDPWMFHQSNLRAYDGTHSLLGDLIDRTLGKYGKVLVLPVQALPMTTLGGQMAGRMRYNAAGIQCSFIPQQGTITISATTAATVPVTGLCLDSAESYGGQCISHIALGPGQSATFQFQPPSTQNQQPLAVGSGPAANVKLSATLSPNPTRREATLSFQTTRPGFARVRVYDVAGHLVRDLVNQSDLPPGVHSFAIGGTRSTSVALSAGIYFYRIEAAEGTVAGRFVVLR